MADNKTEVFTKDDNVPEAPKNAKERLYDHIKVPVWVFDVIIGISIIAIIILIVIGR